MPLHIVMFFVSNLLCFLSPGYLIMSDDWFSEYVYEVVVDKKHVPEDILAVMQQEPIVLPAWDPMGALAKWTAQYLPPNGQPEVDVIENPRDWKP